MGFFSGRKSKRRLSGLNVPKLGTCKVVRGRGGSRTLCFTGKGPTGWEFKRKGSTR